MPGSNPSMRSSVWRTSLPAIVGSGPGDLTSALAAVTVSALSSITYRRTQMSDFGDAG
jgi:hypothetical protein